MKNLYLISAIILIVFLAGCGSSENKNIRKGNSFYLDSNYTEAVNAYKKAVEENPASMKGNFNLSAAYYKLKQYKQAAAILKEMILLAESDSSLLAKLYYNFGNTLLLESFSCGQEYRNMSDSIDSQQSIIDDETNIVEKVDLGVELDSMLVLQDSLLASKDTLLLASIAAYKNSLRYDYTDKNTKYNLIYAMKFLPKNLQNSGSDQKKTQPSEYAIKLKKQADSLVSIFKFSEAYDLLNNAINKDTTVKSYNDFIQKLKDVKDIL